MLILAVLCALAAGWCTGGRLSRFEGAGLRLLPLPVAALLLQRFFLRPWTLLLSYGLLLVFLVCNRHLKKTALFLGAGSLCNLTVIAANGWRMPVAAWAAALMSDEGRRRAALRRNPDVCRRRRPYPGCCFWAIFFTAPSHLFRDLPASETFCWLWAFFSV